MKKPILMLAALAAAAPLGASELAPVPTSLMNRNGVVCVKVTKTGKVRDAFVVQSTGDGTADADMIDWVRSLSWPPARTDAALRETWQPVPVAMGKAEIPVLPDNCAPPRAAR